MANCHSITVKPIAGALGAEVGGVNLSDNLPEETISEIRKALLQYLVIFFHNQNLTIDQQKAFTKRFGTLFVHPNFQLGQKDKETVHLVRQPGDLTVAGEKWHADTTMMKIPPMGAILYALDTPDYGGDTIFSNQYLAYETLSDGMKAMLDGLNAIHSDIRVAGPQTNVNATRSTKVRDDEQWQETVHSHQVIRIHPETGRKCLFVNSIYTTRFENMTHEESKALLDHLFKHQCRPEFTCRFRWKPGSVAFWDNRCTIHLAIHDNQKSTRHMQRTQIAG